MKKTDFIIFFNNYLHTLCSFWLRKSSNPSQFRYGIIKYITGCDTKSRGERGKYTDGTNKGSVEDVYYGNVEVEATIANGNLTSVQFLQYPNSRGNSMMINHRAMPILKSEAIANQTGNVDIVSGATQTSKGFIKSLNNALAKATM
jgi:uncharacterized protein with FMN-binding domain